MIGEARTPTAAVSRGAPGLITKTGVDWGQLTAIGSVVALPMIVVGLAVRHYLVMGLTLGAGTGE